MTILVTGATGKVGRNVVTGLLAAGRTVRAISRSPGRAGLPEDVEVLHADLADPRTLRAALHGVDKVFVFPTAPDGTRALTAAAAHAGVRHLVLLSSTVPGYPEPDPISDAHLAHERIVREAGLPWTFVRPGGFMANDLAWADSVRTGGVVRDPCPDSAVALIDERDIAAVAVAALLDDAHAGRVHEITGPQSLTPAQRTRILARAIGRPLRLELQPADEFVRTVTGRGYPPEYATAMLDFGAHFAVAPGPVLPTVERVTGRPSHTYADWAARYADRFR
ncbi:NAD(P)H-binding protein [Nocardiopsis sp. NPDC006139]|uniref:NAD(P)H-binding protein n=1 Tax=Nocardiopsis sp. NPDC006139 TaxID=3154578 RepID=UPI0033A4C83F